MTKLLYVHGLSSSGLSATAKNLRLLLPECDVIAPDLPVNPDEAYGLLKDLCAKECPELIIGTSMGGMFAQQLRGYRKILVNPAFHVSEFMRRQIGTHEFLNPRQDGETHYEITPELCDAYRRLEEHQFAAISDSDRENTYALFGRNDTLVCGYEEYSVHYKHAEWFEGEHRLDYKVIETVVVPLVRRLLRKESVEEALMASPLFQLSLSSKELFHSNFLYWLGKQYPRLFVAICKAWGCSTDWEDSGWHIRREYKHFDLCVETGGQVVLVLENKVKSLPVKKQLDEYRAKAGDACRDFILLSLATVFPDRKAVEVEGTWRIKSYQELHDVLFQLKEQSVCRPYDRALVEDYGSFVKNLHDLSRCWIPSGESRFLLSAEARETGERLRIRDLQDKFRYSYLCQSLNEHLRKSESWKEVLPGMDIDSIAKDGRCLDAVFTNWGFTHGLGLLEAKIKINDRYVLLVQLQGNRYCRGIEWIGESAKKRHEVLWEETRQEACIQALHYFNFEEGIPDTFPEICVKACIRARKRRDSGKERMYNKYQNAFLYQAKKIREEVSVAEVLDAIKTELEGIVEACKSVVLQSS